MTKVKSKIVFMAILLMALTVSMAHATWEVEQIESGPDDGFITETGVKWFDTTWIELKNREISSSSYYAFRGVNIPEDAIILNASLQFTAPHPYTFPAAESLDVTIYGLKTGDLTSWDPTPDLESEPFTSSFTNFDVTNMSAGISINVTVTNLVKEIYSLNAWTNGNDMGFRVVSVAVDSGLAQRYQESFDNAPLDSMKLYIEYTEATNTTTYYKGYKIVSSSVATYGLDNPDFWIEKPITTVGTGIDRKNVTTWDAWFIHNGIYGEPFDYVEPYQEGMFECNQHDASIDISQVRSPLGSWGIFDTQYDSYGTGVTLYMLGDVGGTLPINGNLGVLNTVGHAWSGTWSTRNSNNQPAVGLLLKAVDNVTASLTPIATNILVSSAVDSTVQDLPEDNYYLIKTQIVQFFDYWMGSQYQFGYINDIFSFDVATGDIVDLGRANIYFNTSNMANDMECLNLFVDYGQGVSGDWVHHQMLRGWNAEISYEPYTVYDENGTLIGGFDTLEDAEAGIDAIDDVGQTPDDPNPPGTNYPDDGFGELTRFNVRFVLFLVGWFLIIAPLIIMVVKPWPMKVYLAFILCIALGFALQWTLGSI